MAHCTSLFFWRNFFNLGWLCASFSSSCICDANFNSPAMNERRKTPCKMWELHWKKIFWSCYPGQGSKQRTTKEKTKQHNTHPQAGQTFRSRKSWRTKWTGRPSERIQRNLFRLRRSSHAALRPRESVECALWRENVELSVDGSLGDNMLVLSGQFQATNKKTRQAKWHSTNKKEVT